VLQTIVFQEGEHDAAVRKYEELGETAKILRMAPTVEPGVRGRATVAAATIVVRSSFEEEDSELISVTKLRKILSLEMYVLHTDILRVLPLLTALPLQQPAYPSGHQRRPHPCTCGFLGTEREP
jgi:hypothetical protein